MSYKPSDFAVGFSDVIGVLMPGAVMVYVLEPHVKPRLHGLGLPDVGSEAPAWVAFVVASYFLGHLAFLIGSFLDYLYGPLRKKFKPTEKDQLYSAATDYKKQLLGDMDECINTYKFAKAILGLGHEAASNEVQRLEAESKFFRSVVTVMAVTLGVVWSGIGVEGRIVGVILIMLSVWRYAERRWKSTESAYAYVLAISRNPTNATDRNPASAESNKR